jgi:hypothetical protein
LANSRSCGVDLKFQLSVLRLAGFYLLIQRVQRRFRSVDVQLKICGINFKQEIAALYELIVSHIDLDDWTGNARRNSNYVRPGYCVVRPGMSLIEVPGSQAQPHRQTNYDQAQD